MKNVVCHKCGYTQSFPKEVLEDYFKNKGTYIYCGQCYCNGDKNVLCKIQDNNK